jgi:hypothetical protein
LPSSVSLEAFSRVFDAAVRGGPDVLIGKDELLASRPPESTWVEALLSKVRPDPWRAELAKLTKDRTSPILSAEIEDALRGAGLTDRLDNEGHAKVLGIMKRLGWVKKNPTIDGARKWAFVRVEDGDA